MILISTQLHRIFLFQNLRKFTGFFEPGMQLRWVESPISCKRDILIYALLLYSKTERQATYLALRRV